MRRIAVSHTYSGMKLCAILVLRPYLVCDRVMFGRSQVIRVSKRTTVPEDTMLVDALISALDTC